VENIKITQLRAENFMKIKLVELNIDGTITTIGGNNGNGKSSMLYAFEALLGGTKGIAKVPIRKGCDMAQIVGKFSNGLTISRIIREGKPASLEIKTKEGYTVSSPQAFLKEIIGNLAFDPLAFNDMKPKDQVELLKRTFSIDTGKFEIERDEAFDARKTLNATIKRLDAQWEDAEFYEDVKETEEVQTMDVVKELDDAKAHNANRYDLQEEVVESGEGIEVHEDDIKSFEEAIKEFENNIKQMNLKIDMSKEHIDQKIKIIKEIETELNTTKDIDLEPIQTKLEQVDEKNKQIRANERRRVLGKELHDFKNKVTVQEFKLDKARKAITKAIEEAEFPTEGLGFDDSGVTFNDLPFDQESTAGKLKVSVAIALAANPQLPLLLIPNGSNLDAASLKTIAEMADKEGAQVIMEVVGESDEYSIIMEDGAEKAPQSENKA